MATKKNKGGCIDPANVPCEKARDYLAKRGLLCGITPDKPLKTPKKVKSFLDEWLG